MARIPATTATALLVALLTAPAVNGYPAGFFSCDNTPGHSSLAQPTGFTVTLRNSVGSAVTAWMAGEAHTVTMARSGGAFRGFVAAVFPGATWGGDYSAAKAGALSAGANSHAGGCGGVTQTSRADKTTVTWAWSPPAAGTGAVSFYATAVIGYSSSWMQVTQAWPEVAPPSETASVSATAASSPSRSPAASVSGSSTSTPAVTPSPSGLPTGTSTPSPTPSSTASATASQTASATGSTTTGVSSSGTATPAATTASQSGAPAPSGTPTTSPSGSTAPSQSASPTASGTAAASAVASSAAQTTAAAPSRSPLPSSVASPAPCSRQTTCGGRGSCVVGSGGGAANSSAAASCRCDVGYRGAGCASCVPPAYRNATALGGGACVLPRAGVRLLVHALLRGLPGTTARELAAGGTAGDAARTAFAAALQADLRRALGLPATSPSSARRQLQAAVAAVLEVHSLSPVLVDVAAGTVAANVTISPPTPTASNSSGSGGGGAASSSFDAVVTRLLGLLEQAAAAGGGTAGGSVWGSSSTVAAYIDAQATLDGLATAASAGTAYVLLPAAAPPSTYAFRVQLGPSITLEWAPPSYPSLAGDGTGAGGGGDRVHVRLTCAAGGGWCGVGVNRAATMIGGVAVALEPGRAPESRLSAWTLGGKARPDVVQLPDSGSASSPIDLSLGTPAAVDDNVASSLVATWAWPVSATHGHLRTDEPVTLIYATGSTGTLGSHTAGTAGAASVHFGTGAASALDLQVKSAVVAHAVLMLLGWLALAPLGIAIARFGKGWLGAAPAAKGGDAAAAAPATPRAARWFPAHWQVQLCGQLAALVGVVIVLATRPAGTPHFATTHERLGLAVFLLGLLQPLLASHCVRPAKAPAPQPQPLARAAWEAVHKTAGYGGVVVAAAAVYLGLAQARWSSERTLTGLFSAYLALVALAFVVLEVRARCAPPPPPVVTRAAPSTTGDAALPARNPGESWGKCNSLRSGAFWGALPRGTGAAGGGSGTAAAGSVYAAGAGPRASTDPELESRAAHEFAADNPLSQRAGPMR